MLEILEIGMVGTIAIREIAIEIRTMVQTKRLEDANVKAGTADIDLARDPMIAGPIVRTGVVGAVAEISEVWVLE